NQSIFSNQITICTMVMGKVKVSYDCSYGDGGVIKSESAFYEICAAEIVNDYLYSSLSKSKYSSLPYIELDIHQYDVNFQDYEIKIQDSTINIIAWSSTELISKTLKLVDYAISNYKSFRKKLLSSGEYEIWLFGDEIIDNSVKREIIEKPLNKNMKACISKTYYRGNEDKWVRDNYERFNTIYSLRNDTFFITCDGKELLKLNSIVNVLRTKHLGYFIFDSDSTFYYFNPSDVYKAKNDYVMHDRYEFGKIKGHFSYSPNNMQISGYCGDLSKRHAFKAPWLYIVEEDVVNNRVVLGYNSDYRDRSTFLGKHFKGINTIRKFMYLIDDDILIPDYQILEQKIIDENKKYYR
ncbi:hypothetical protein ACE01N_20480, partial [Saccharicrinis sp. FJH2]|uniref:hypothetical protein n=1 Tax=Saccharicrinis sp. FJH65 TaxID=3344659 RepID=UPI0035F3075C